jgi:uncharacterized membrane protein YadS
MYNILLHSHSGFRYLILILVFASLISSYTNSKRQSKNKGNGLIYRFTVILIHIQFLVGVSLFFISPKVNFDPNTFSSHLIRFFTIEHTIMMLLAIILFTVGNSKFKRETDAKKAHRKILIYFTLGFLIMMLSIPWPAYNLGTQWF